MDLYLASVKVLVCSDRIYLCCILNISISFQGAIDHLRLFSWILWEMVPELDVLLKLYLEVKRVLTWLTFALDTWTQVGLQPEPKVVLLYHE